MTPSCGTDVQADKLSAKTDAQKTFADKAERTLGLLAANSLFKKRVITVSKGNICEFGCNKSANFSRQESLEADKRYLGRAFA